MSIFFSALRFRSDSLPFSPTHFSIFFFQEKKVCFVLTLFPFIHSFVIFSRRGPGTKRGKITSDLSKKKASASHSFSLLSSTTLTITAIFSSFYLSWTQLKLQLRNRKWVLAQSVQVHLFHLYGTHSTPDHTHSTSVSFFSLSLKT